MFGPTYKVQLTLDANNVPTAMASATSENVLSGALSHITSVLTPDTVVIGAGRTLGEAALVYGSMSLVNYKLTGKFHVNPLSVK